MPPRKKTVTLECGCSVKVPESVVHQWIEQPEATVVFCADHKVQNIRSAEGPEALAKLFRL